MGFCYQKNFCNPTMPVDEAQFYALVRGTEWGEKIDKFRETGDQAIKRKLPAFIFQATFDDTTSKAGKTGAWRKQVATKLTGLVVMDIDHVDNPLTLYQGWIEKGLDLKALGIVLIYITPSGKGIKIVFKARLDWGNLIDNHVKNLTFCILIKNCLLMRIKNLLRDIMLYTETVIARLRSRCHLDRTPLPLCHLDRT